MGEHQEKRGGGSKMRKLLVATHGYLAKGYQSSLKILTGANVNKKVDHVPEKK